MVELGMNDDERAGRREVGRGVRRGVWSACAWAVVAASFAALSAMSVGCAGSGRGRAFVAPEAEPAMLAALEGDWANADPSSRIREIEFDRDGGEWTLEVDRLDDAGEEVEDAFPLRVLRFGGRTIVETEIARGQGQSGPAAAFAYSMVEIDGDRLTGRPLRGEWLDAYVRTEPMLRIAAVEPWGGEARTLAVGEAVGMRRMVEAAAADPAAWGEPTNWTRERDEEEGPDGAGS
jgi:hypothetical protein